MMRLATLRSHNQYNTTVYGLDDRHRGVFGGRMVVFMNEADMKTRGIEADGTGRHIEAVAGGDGRKSASCADSSVETSIRSREDRLPRYYPEANPLLPLGFLTIASKTPAAKSIPALVTPQ